MTSIAYSPKGDLIATADYGNPYLADCVRVWDVATGRLYRSFLRPNDRPCSVVFFPDGKRLAVACIKDIRIFVSFRQACLN